MSTYACKRCHGKFEGRFCPYCGAERGSRYGAGRPVGFFGGLLRFITSLLALVVVLAVILIALDCTPYASDPAHATIYAVVQSMRNAFPPAALAVYDSVKAQAFEAVRHWFEQVR